MRLYNLIIATRKRRSWHWLVHFRVICACTIDMDSKEWCAQTDNDRIAPLEFSPRLYTTASQNVMYCVELLFLLHLSIKSVTAPIRMQKNGWRVLKNIWGTTNYQEFTSGSGKGVQVHQKCILSWSHVQYGTDQKTHNRSLLQCDPCLTGNPMVYRTF